jgi:hypothetical protein
VVTACLLALRDAEINIPFDILTVRPSAELQTMLSAGGGDEG